MARKVWIGVLGFGLFLFVMLDFGLLWYLINSKSSARGYGSLLILIFATWHVFVALKRRIDSKPEKRIVEHGIQD
jgi:inner membrane protein involved in colicin E2 resistance